MAYRLQNLPANGKQGQTPEQLYISANVTPKLLRDNFLYIVILGCLSEGSGASYTVYGKRFFLILENIMGSAEVRKKKELRGVNMYLMYLYNVHTCKVNKVHLCWRVKTTYGFIYIPLEDFHIDKTAP
jgi:hypothetical protein